MYVIDNEKDKIRFEDAAIFFTIDRKEQAVDFASVRQLSILTSDRGPAECDTALAIFTDEEIYIINAENDRYSELLFDVFGKQFPIDYSTVISASACCDNVEFIIYERR